MSYIVILDILHKDTFRWKWKVFLLMNSFQIVVESIPTILGSNGSSCFTNFDWMCDAVMPRPGTHTPFHPASIFGANNLGVHSQQLLSCHPFSMLQPSRLRCNPLSCIVCFFLFYLVWGYKRKTACSDAFKYIPRQMMKAILGRQKVDTTMTKGFKVCIYKYIINIHILLHL